VNRSDIDLLIADVTGRTTAWIIAHDDTLIEEHALEEMLQRRLSGEPLQYIRQRAEFFGRDFYVDDRVLIPRPETEILVELAIERIPQGARVLDIGTGSGCIASLLASSRPDLRVIAADVSVAALVVARRNEAERIVASDLLTAFRKPFDVIVSNPPYIAEAEVEELMTEVRDHEPRIALTPGPLGTEIIERILENAGDALVILEIAFGQVGAVRDLAESKGLEVEEVRNDLAGIPRVIVLSRHGRQ
jgi:release factor glutamine methyltransferase